MPMSQWFTSIELRIRSERERERNAACDSRREEIEVSFILDSTVRI